MATEIGSPPNKEKLTALLAEYNTLRTEILQRYTVLVSFVTVSLPLSVTLCGSIAVERPLLALGLAIPLGTVLSVVAWLINGDFERLHDHIVRLEGEINRELGDTVLTWQSQHGLPPKWRQMVKDQATLIRARTAVRGAEIGGIAKAAATRSFTRAQQVGLDAIRRARDRIRAGNSN